MEGWREKHEGDDEDEFQYRECYEFNEKLDEGLNDEKCEHCRKFLTTMCEHIDEFLDEDDDA